MPTLSTARAPVILLDRDGTLVIDRGYLGDPAGLEFLPGAAEALRRLHRAGHRLVVVSNQSGVGRGLLSEERLQQINARLKQMVREAGAELAGIYCCPHRPEERCECRKPGTALVQQAARELGFDPSAAVVIGDKASDVELGRRLGALTVRLAPGDAAVGAAHAAGAPDSLATGGVTDRCEADYVVSDLAQAATLIERLTAAHAVAAGH